MISIQQLTSYVGFCLSFAINSLLIYMIRKKTRPLGCYVYLMMSFSVFELVFSTIDVLNQPMIFVENGKFLFFSPNPLHLNTTFSEHFNMINFACSGIIISLLAIHFFYRYMAVCNNQVWLSHFEMPKFFLWILLFLFFGLEWYLATLWLGKSFDDCEVDMDGIMANFDVDPKYTVFIGIKYHVSNVENSLLCGKSIVLAVILLKIVLISCATVTYCGIRTWREITTKKRAISRKTLEIQRQFFRALVVQTLIPIFLLYLPLATMLIAPIFMANLAKIDIVIQFAFVFYPILDPIAVLFIVRDYRKTMKAALKIMFNWLFWDRLIRLLNLSLTYMQTEREIRSPPVVITPTPAPAMPRFIY